MAMKRWILGALTLLASALPAAAQSYDPTMEPEALYYEGLYWHYYQHNWYVSQLQAGPWAWVEPVYVPVYVQQVPIGRVRHPRLPLPDPQLARRMQSNPQMPSDAAVKSYFWGPQVGAKLTTGVERPRR